MTLLLKKEKVLKAIFNPFILATVSLVITVSIFDFSFFVNSAREMFPHNFDSSCQCECILDARKWYGKINPWTLLWAIFTPMITFSIPPHSAGWKRALRTAFVFTASYLLVFIATQKHFEILTAPFSYLVTALDSSALESFKADCFYRFDSGPALTFAVLFGWIPALLYTALWEIIWVTYHKRKTKLIDKNFDRDWVSKFVIYFSATIFFILVIFVMWRLFIA